MKNFSDIVVKSYSPSDRGLIEDFREKSFAEGNESISYDKYNPDSIRGQTWLTFVQGELAAISVCQASYYTGDESIAARICRYHILKKYRHCNAGFRMLPHQIAYAKNCGHKVVYWTCDINNRPLNELYSKRRVIPGKGHFFRGKSYQGFTLKKNYLFKVSKTSNFLQYIYQKILLDGYDWIPQTNVVYHPWRSRNLDIKNILLTAKEISYHHPKEGI